MMHPQIPRHIEVKQGDQTVVAAEVTVLNVRGGTVRTSLHPTTAHVAPGPRAILVDVVMDLPEVQASSRLEATIPLGDTELLERLRERTVDAVTRPAGSTALVDAAIPPARQPGATVPPARQPGATVPPARQPGATIPPARQPGATIPPARQPEAGQQAERDQQPDGGHQPG